MFILYFNICFYSHSNFLLIPFYISGFSFGFNLFLHLLLKGADHFWALSCLGSTPTCNSPVLLMFGNAFFFNFISPAFCLSRISYCLMNPILWSKADVDSFNLKKPLFYHPRIKGGYPGICSDLSLEVKGSQVLISTFFFSIMSITIKNQAK